jgi:arylsulfatase A-like enzyme
MDNKLLLSLGLTLAGTAAWAQDHPNIVLFLVDDMGLMDTSVPFLTDGNGNPVRYPLNDWYRTPSMERLANQGVRFSQFYAQGVSSPSRASLLTGQDAARHRVTNWIRSEGNNRDDYGPYDWNWEGLRGNEPLLPRVLQEAGYRTIHIGKGHFGPFGSEGEDPLNLGFEVNVAGSSIGEPGSYLGENGYGLLRGTRSRAVPGLDKYHGTDTFLTEALTLEALAQIDTAVAAGKPFFLYMSHYAVHNPFEIDKRFIAHYQDTTFSQAARGYATLIEGMDKSLGDILDHLEAAGVAENTLVVFLGDNGSDAPLGGGHDIGSSAPLRGKKGSEFEGGTRVPCIIAWARPNPANPSQHRYSVRQGVISPDVATIMDIYPTLTLLAGAKVPLPPAHTEDGSLLWGLLGGYDDPWHEDIFLNHFPHQHRGSYFTTWRHGDWKLVYYYNPDHPDFPQCTLYNLKDDPSESRDVLRKHPRIARRLLREMIDRLRRDNATYPVDFEGKPVPPREDAVR